MFIPSSLLSLVSWIQNQRLLSWSPRNSLSWRLRKIYPCKLSHRSCLGKNPDWQPLNLIKAMFFWPSLTSFLLKMNTSTLPDTQLRSPTYLSTCTWRRCQICIYQLSPSFGSIWENNTHAISLASNDNNSTKRLTVELTGKNEKKNRKKMKARRNRLENKQATKTSMNSTQNM